MKFYLMTARTYLVLARELKSIYYLKKARQQLDLYLAAKQEYINDATLEYRIAA